MQQQNNILTIPTKYGTFSSEQFEAVKISLRKSIFFLLLYVDRATCDSYPNVDINNAFKSLQLKLNGLNSILLEPPELVIVMSLIESALQEFNKPDFDFKVYRKLILDAGSEIMKIHEVGD